MLLCLLLRRHACKQARCTTTPFSQPQRRATTVPGFSRHTHQNTGTTQLQASNVCSAEAPDIPVCRGRIATCAHKAIEQVDAIQRPDQQPAAAHCFRCQHGCSTALHTWIQQHNHGNSVSTHHHDTRTHKLQRGRPPTQLAAMHVVRTAAMTKRRT